MLTVHRSARAPWKTFALIAAFFMGGLSACATTGGGGKFYADDGPAIDGYDPVAYFTEQDAVPGDASHSHSWRGVNWHFSSAANRDLFAADPEAYAPQYGGYCAYAASNNSIAPTDPQAWTVHEGKLYLNYSKHVRKRWLEDVPGHIQRADTNWPGLQETL